MSERAVCDFNRVGKLTKTKAKSSCEQNCNDDKFSLCKRYAFHALQRKSQLERALHKQQSAWHFSALRPSPDCYAMIAQRYGIRESF